MHQPTEDAEDRAFASAVDEPCSDSDASQVAPRSRRHVLALFARYVAPALAAIALVLVLAGEQADIDHDLQLIAPGQAVAGQLLPVRARLYSELDASQGPSLSRTAVELRLESETGALLSSTILKPARGSTPDSEGSLRLPQRAGTTRLAARARIAGREAQVQRPLRVVADQPSVLPRGRQLRALQQYAAGPILADAGQTPPAALLVRVRGGACIPELPCRALVYVGPPAASLRVEATAALTPSPDSTKPSPVTDAIVALEFVTHGPEAELRLIAERVGQRVARRTVRLPIALSSFSVSASTGPQFEAQPHVHAIGVDGACIIDAFRDGHWLRTGSLAACERHNQVPFAALPPGSYRLQVRSDVFSAQSAAVAHVYVRAPAEAPSNMVRVLAREARAFDPSDDFAKRCAVDHERCSDPGAAAYLSAVLESGIFEPPTAASGYPAAVTQLRERQSRLRNLSLVALAFGALSLALSIGRRGLSAGARSRAFLTPQSLDPRFNQRARLRSLAVVVASVFSLVLVFVVIALYVMARGGY